MSNVIYKLLAKTIVEEVFLWFSSKSVRDIHCEEHFAHLLIFSYPDILEAQLQFLYTNAMMAKVMTGIQSKIQSAIHGGIPHAESVLLAFL